MCCLQRSVRCCRLRRSVTCGTDSSGGMVIFMAIPAFGFRPRWLERDRRRVTLDARALRVLSVQEINGTRLRLVTRDRDHGRHLLRRGILGGAMAGRASRSCGCLMMADSAASRCLERELAVGIAGRMTHEARNLLVPRVGKAVGRSRGGRGRPDSHEYRRGPGGFEDRSQRIVSGLRCRLVEARQSQSDRTRPSRALYSQVLSRRVRFGAPQRFHRIEGQRGLRLSSRPNAHVTTLTLACIDLCRVREVTRQAL
jgi:hypothetical protein